MAGNATWAGSEEGWLFFQATNLLHIVLSTGMFTGNVKGPSNIVTVTDVMGHGPY